MKFILSILVIIMALIFTGMQGAYAQATLHVQWNPQDCDECPSLGDWVWRVDIAVIDQCGEEFSIVYEDNQFIEPPDAEATFVLSRFCDRPSLEECYHVIAVVRKLCPNGLGGFTVICEGKNAGIPKSCPWLMNSQSWLDVPIIFL